MAGWRWQLAALLLFVGAAALVLRPASASYHCPFCSEERGPTLIGDFKEASMVIYGHFTNPKLDPTAGLEAGTSDFVIEQVLKSHDIIKDKKIVTLPKYIPEDKKKFVLFCDVYMNNVNPYRGEEVVENGELLKYLTSALKLQDADLPKRLRHCFDFLNSPDLVVSMDAYREFAKADYTDYRDMAKTLPAKTLAEWLDDPKTPTYRYGLYSSLLGHCGDPKVHGGIIREMLVDPKKRQNSGLEGMMAGYVMLQPKEGWAFLQKTLKEDKDDDFYMRYAVVGTLRFFQEVRKDVISKEQILQGMSMLLDQPDVSDFAMDDLRNWKVWEMTDRILDLFTKDSHDNPVIKRAILRFALCSPTDRAKAFVGKQRVRDPSWVSDTEDLLRVDTPLPKALATDPKKK